MIKKIGSLVNIEKINLQKINKKAFTNEISNQIIHDLDTNNFSYFRARAVSGGELHGPNSNGDWFSRNELKKSYSTFIGKGFYINHESDDVRNAKGVLLDAVWHEEDNFEKVAEAVKNGGKAEKDYVEIVFAIDKKNFPDIAYKFDNGIINDVSMGAMVGECSCNICGKICKSESDYCEHLRNFLGKQFDGQRKIAINDHGKCVSINTKVGFYELSGVNVGADTNAKVLEKIATMKEMGIIEIYKPLVKKYSLLKNKEDDMHNKKTSKVMNIIKNATSILKKSNEDEMDIENEVEETNEEDIQPVTLDDNIQISDNEIEEEVVELGDGYSVVDSGKDNLVELLNRGESTGIYVNKEVGDSELDQISAYRNKLKDVLKSSVEYKDIEDIPQENMEEEIPMSEIEDASNKLLEEIKVSKNRKEMKKIDKKKKVKSGEDSQLNKLKIKYVAGENFEDSKFVAETENLICTVSASDILDKELQQKILEKEASEGPREPSKVVDNVPEKTDTSMEEKTNETLDGEGPREPSKVVDNVPEKTDTSMSEKTDTVLAQPEDYIKKFEKLSKGNIVHLSRIWKGSKLRKKESIESEENKFKKSAKIGGTINLALEDVPMEKKSPRDIGDVKALEMQVTEEGKPSGARGNEIKNYYKQMGSASLSDNPDSEWAIEDFKKAYAKIQNELKIVKARNNVLSAELKKQSEIKEQSKKTALINKILEIYRNAGALNSEETDIISIADEKSISLEDARIIASKRNVEKMVKEFNTMSSLDLEKTLKSIERISSNNQIKTSFDSESLKKKASGIPNVYTPENGILPEDQLSQAFQEEII